MPGWEATNTGSAGESLPGDALVYTVSQLNRGVRDALEIGFPQALWVEGELSNLARPSSGHLYFSLKDDAAAVRCALFRSGQRSFSFEPRNGLQVLARARVSLYERRGDYQLIVEHLEEAGTGRLQRAFEELKRRLHAEGLFDATRKRELPAHMGVIGVLTSPSGAALRDVLSVLRRRYPLAQVRLYPVPVQGREAAPALARMLGIASGRAECDVLLLVRGGGSLEDLWPFNEEQVARAIAACELPVVSGVGHEIDYTIADLVADLRAPTPSAAAELVSPDQGELRQLLAGAQAALEEQLRGGLERRWDLLRAWGRRLRGPPRFLREAKQAVDEQELRLHQVGRRLLRERRLVLRGLKAGTHRPGSAIPGLRERRLVLRGLKETLVALDPERVLRRGYAILRHQGVVVRRAAALRIGARVEAQLAQGVARLEVLESLSETPSSAPSSGRNGRSG